ncbi:MAG: hypothetical protein E7047_09490 [Lentisphaerae bacterium]|nr:hypothetical protein [Lentisphaerota bacterium]
MYTVAELEKLITYHNDLYWKQAAPEISDVEYDALMRELEALAPDHPLLTAVHGTAVASSGKVRHSEPMLSLDKAYSLEKVLEWADKFVRSADEMLLVQPKYDGISARWENDMLVTRGDGSEGENITDKVPLIELESIDYTGVLRSGGYIRGEIVIRDDDFRDLYSRIKRKNGTVYKNSRNAVAGIMSLKEIGDIQAQGAKLTLVDYRKISYSCSRRELPEYFADFLEKIENLPYPTDGVVIKLADEIYAASLGNTAHHPRGAIAFKFTNIRRQSVLRNVVWSFGKNCLTPVAEIDPVEIGGVTITHATLHNLQNVLDRDIQINDIVEVERAGDVIPYIVNSLPGENRQSVIISSCPCCGSTLEQHGPELCCVNKDCFEVRLQNLLAAVRNIGIERLGEPTLRKMMQTLQVRTLKDIFELTKADIMQLESFKDKSSENLCKEIAKARQVNDYQLLASLNIPNVGVNVAKTILEVMPLEDLRQADEAALSLIAGIGPERAAAIHKTLQEQSAFIDEMLDAVELIRSEASAQDRPSVCFTGKMPEKRSYYEKLAESRGYAPADSVNKFLSLLVAADVNDNSSKLVKARKLGIKIVSLEEFLSDHGTPTVLPAAPVMPEVLPAVPAVPEKTESDTLREIGLFSMEDDSAPDGAKPPETEKNKPAEQLTFGF